MGQNQHKFVLQRVALKALVEKGFETTFPRHVIEELQKIQGPAVYKNDYAKEQRHLIWCSIDNEDSRDIDQLSYAEQLPDKKVKVMVAVADVDELVNIQSKIDHHAGLNTATIYTIAQIFPMLPEMLSTDLTSLNFDSDRCAIVAEMIVGEDGNIHEYDVYCAMVHNYAKLDYDTVGAWLDGKIPVPEAIKNVKGLEENIQLQERMAQKMKELRHEHGALEFETLESRPVFDGDILCEMKEKKKNRAQGMIEDFMIATNGVIAQYLEKKGYPSLRRVVRTPKKWDRIGEIAAENGFTLPPEANSRALSQFLKSMKQNKPDEYSDISHSILKLIGGGEYLVDTPDNHTDGHFGLAVKDYSHSTAPNRRYSDLITHRLLKSAMTGSSIPYTTEELEQIARNCTVKEDYIRKIERQIEKSANAILLESKIGETFDGIITGAASKGTWVKTSRPQLEGKLVKGFEGLQVGNKIKVRLITVDVESGFIDFEKCE